MTELESMEKDWAMWASDRPQIVKDIADRLRPWLIYRLISTHQRCQLNSISENGTVTVNILHPQENIALYQVFGINPDDLQAPS